MFRNNKIFLNIKLDFKIFFVLFILTILNIYGSEFSDDINHYHYSYITNTDQSNYIWGLSFLHPLFGTSPLWLVGHSYFNFDSSVLQDIHILNGVLFFLICGLFITELKNSNKDLSPYHVIICSFLIFILIKYTRLKEFGIDRPAYILSFFLIYFYFKYFNFKQLDKKTNFFLVLSLVSMSIFFIKIIFIFYLLIPLYVLYLYKSSILKFNIKTNFLLIIFFSYLVKNFLISGCFLFPSSLSCLKTIPWNNFNGAFILAQDSEIFNKSWPLYNGNLNEIEYIKNFNWFKTWFVRHKVELLEIISTFILVIFLTILSFKFKTYRSLKKNYNFYSTEIIIFIIIIFSLILFFLKNPNIRMNHHILIFSMVLMFINFLRFKIINIKKNFFWSIIVIAIIFNYSKNLDRLIEIEFNNEPIKILSKKIKKPKKYNIDEFEYYVGWYGNTPIGNNILKNKKFKKLSIFKIIY